MSVHARVVVFLAAFCCLLTPPLPAQWLPVSSPTKSDLLSVDVREQAVWASGKDDVAIRSEDGGQSWQLCAPVSKVRGTAITSIAAVDANTAVAISSGKGQSSKAYRTADGCKSWQVVFENAEETSSFDTLRRVVGQQIYLLAEPVSGKFAMYLSQDGGQKWFIADDAGLDALPDESAAATTIVTSGPYLYFGTHAAPHPRLHFTIAKCEAGAQTTTCPIEWTTSRFPVEAGTLRAIGTRTATNLSGKVSSFVMGLSTDGVSAMSSISSDGGAQWSIPAAFPLAQPIAVAFWPAKQKWIAAGMDGTASSDASGKHWVKAAEAGSTTDSGWSAMSLPFAVGSSGHIGRLDPDKLP